MDKQVTQKLQENQIQIMKQNFKILVTKTEKNK